MIEKFRRLSRLSQTAILVFAGHFFLGVVLSIHHLFYKAPPKTKMVVHTFKVAPPAPKKKVAPPLKKQGVQKKEAPTSKKPAPKKPVEKKKAPEKKVSPNPQKKVPEKKAPTEPKNKAEPKKKGAQEKKSQEPPQKKKPDVTAVVQKIEKNLVDLKEDTPKEVLKTTLTIPQEPTEVLEKESSIVSCGEALICFFQGALDLPDYGEVVVDLELDESGHVKKVNIVESKSQLNEEFLKNRLPELTVPCFTQKPSSGDSFAFTIVFKNQ